MKRILLAIFILSACAQAQDLLHPVNHRQERIRQTADWLNVLYWGSFDQPACLQYMGPVNAIFFGASYGPYYASVYQNHQTIILGDSTMDISSRYSGWLDPAKTMSYAASGNTSCDMSAEMRAIQGTVSPTSVLIAMNGGNDIAGQRATIAQSIQSNKDLIDKVHARWPWARIVVVGIHPTEVTYANQNKATVNSAVQAYLATIPNTCYYNPLPLFGVAEGQAAPTGLMLDAIHYNQSVSFALKSALFTNCGLAL